MFMNSFARDSITAVLVLVAIGGADIEIQRTPTHIIASIHANEIASESESDIDLYFVLSDESERGSIAGGERVESRYATALQLPDLSGQHSMTGALQTEIRFTFMGPLNGYEVELYDKERGWWFAGWASIDEAKEHVVLDNGIGGMVFKPSTGGGWDWSAAGPGGVGFGKLY